VIAVIPGGCCEVRAHCSSVSGDDCGSIVAVVSGGCRELRVYGLLYSSQAGLAIRRLDPCEQHNARRPGRYRSLPNSIYEWEGS
jgi:hypothetical protein